MDLHYTLSAILILTAAHMNGQDYSLTASEQLPVGSEYTVRAIQNIAAVDTTPGTGMIWDHTALVATGANFDVSVLATAASPYGSTFPSSNFCLYEASIPRYSYFENTPQSMSRIGFWRDQLGIYSDPQTELVYPVVYNSSNSDTWANNTVTFPGTYAYTVIGTGSLLLPSGTYDNVLLLRVETENVFEFDQYVWLSASNGAYLLIYNVESLFGPPSGQMITSLDVGINEPSAGLDLRVHAAANGQLAITYRSIADATYRILDVSGRLISTGNLGVSMEPRTSLIDVTMLGTGMHLLELMTGNERRSLRFFMD